MGCKGIHCPGCGDGGGAGLAAVVIVLVVAVIVAKAKAIGDFMAEVGHVLVLVAITGASIAVAAVAVTGAVLVHRRLNRIDRATGQMRATLTGHSYGELPEPGRAELPAPRADIPAKVFIHPPKNRVSR
jgi:hypothetical protein